MDPVSAAHPQILRRIFVATLSHMSYCQAPQLATNSILSNNIVLYCAFYL